MAGASLHLKDKVCGRASKSNHLPSSPEYRHPSLLHLSLFPVQNGVTAVEIAEVKTEEEEEGRPYDGYREERPQYNYEGVISLLGEHCKEATTNHHVSITLCVGSGCGLEVSLCVYKDSYFMWYWCSVDLFVLLCMCVY